MNQLNFDINDYKVELINLINRIKDQFHIEWLHLNQKIIAKYQKQNLEYQQILKDVMNYNFDEDQYDLIEEEHFDKNKIEQISNKLQEKDLQDYMLSQFEILKKQIKKYFFLIYSDAQYNIQINEKYKTLLLEGTKDFLFLIFIKAGIIMNNKFQRCRLIIITYKQNDFSFCKKFETDINYKIYKPKVICNHELNQIGLYTNEVFCLYDAKNQHLVQYVLNNSQNVSIFYHNTILQIENSIFNKLIYQNQILTSSKIHCITSFQKPYQLLLYQDFLIIYFEKIISVIYCKNGKSLQIKKNLTNLPGHSQIESLISINSKLIYQIVHKDKFHSYIYQFSLLNGKILRKLISSEKYDTTQIHLMKFDKILIIISSDLYVEVYNTILANLLLHLHIQSQMIPSDSLLKVIDNKFLASLDYDKLSIWKQELDDMSFLINMFQTSQCN